MSTTHVQPNTKARNSHTAVDVKGYDSATIMGKTSRMTRHLSRMLHTPNASMTVAQAMEAAYSAMNLFNPSQAAPKKKVKPWEKRDKGKVGNKWRRKLLSLKTLTDRNVEFRPTVPFKVGLRLEKTMGTPNLKLFDQQYMNKLSEKINLLDQSQFEERIEKRKIIEVQRRRQLVIDGKAEPESGEEDLLNHPIIRCRRVMQKVNKVQGDQAVVRGIPVPFQMKNKKLTLVEPFDSYEKNGILFGEHKDHYLRVKRVSGESGVSEISDYQSAFHLPAFLSKTPSQSKKAKRQKNKNRVTYSMLDITGDSQDDLGSQSVLDIHKSGSALSDSGTTLPSTKEANPQTTSETVATDAPNLDENLASTAGKNVGSESTENGLAPISAEEVNTDSDKSSITYKEEPPEEPQQGGMVELVEGSKKGRHPTPTCLTDRTKGFSLGELEKLFRKVQSNLVVELLKDEETGSSPSLFDAAANVSETYKREQAKVDQFIKSVHRKSFDNPKE